MLSTALLAVGIVMLLLATRHERDELDTFFDFIYGYWWISGVVSMIGLVCLATSIKGALLVWFAPKVWLLKELATLMK